MGMLAIVTLAAAPNVSLADESDGIKKGRVTGLPIPRFVSLKAPAVNLRVGPGRAYSINWLYKRSGLPVEVIQEFDRWRRVRDAEGTTGWVLHSLLSSRRTAIVAPWDREIAEDGTVTSAQLLDAKYRARGDAATVAKVQAGLLVDLKECHNGWCEIEASNTSAYLPQAKLWGTYPGELIDG
ncbi:SH3 domain-containing protein [Pseudahrensia aquimaris]|uniref:SH3 domain-containing protein n=1 Tax=Pseudahrensia aquimaris TaxID=744461 RepID=A0ABW3FIF2_9HYPH